MDGTGYPGGDLSNLIHSQESPPGYQSGYPDFRAITHGLASDHHLPNNSYNQSPDGEERSFEQQNSDSTPLQGGEEQPAGGKRSRALREKEANGAQGRWHKIEHQRFIEAIKKYGKDWKAVEQYIATRSGSQIRSHAQKFFNRIIKKYTIEKQDVINFIQSHYNFAESSGSTTPVRKPKKDSKYLITRKSKC